MQKPLAKPIRVPLGRSGSRLSFERTVLLWLAGTALPTLLLASYLVFDKSGSWIFVLGTAVILGLGWALLSALFFERLIHPMQTLTNVVAALREDDFSFRARGGRRGDALGDLTLEINTLAGTLQVQRATALDALTLVERVLTSMQSPVLAFDESGHLRLRNAAAITSFALPQQKGPGEPVAMHASQLGLGELLAIPDQGRYPADANGGASVRWSVRRASFRLQGVPHTLFVLTDVAAALREEERSAWQRLIRVLGHEINNSLTPIKSIAGSLQARLRSDAEEALASNDMQRGLAVIEDRAASLNRFLQAYQRLSRLPSPALRQTEITALITQVSRLETRLQTHVEPGPALVLSLDPDQIQQALINLLQNAADAALSEHAEDAAQVSVSWTIDGSQLAIRIVDNGPGITNPGNLFVPFYTTKATGSGIGLVLAQQIVSAHGGAITLKSLPDQAGCVAELLLPLH